jgi:hypothetical protein
MRKRHWLSSLLSSALWAALPAVGFAQAPEAGYVPYIDPNSPQAAGMAPAYGGYEQAGWPQGAAAWPQISPYMAPPVDQTYYQNGFWFNEQSGRDRKYFTYLGATLNTYADPDDVLVGDPDAPGYVFQSLATGTGNNANVTNGSLYDFTAAHDWSEVEGQISGGGFYGIMGYMNPDDTGVYLTGFWAEEGSARLDLVDPPGDIDRPETTLRVRGGVPLFDGLGPTTLPIRAPDLEAVVVEGGGTQRYDMLYRLAWQSQSYGTGLGLYGSTFVKGDSFRLRPVYGLRYLNIRENATFDGMDSSLDYVLTVTTSTGNGGGTANQNVRGAPDPGTVDDLGFEPITSHLRSNTKAHLAGPEAGLSFELGGDKFRIQLQSKLGLLANHSTREIDGFGIGRSQLLASGNAVTGTTGTTNATVVGLPDDPTLSQFHEQETTTHVSPTFEQSIMVSAPILKYVPLVKKVRLFEEANFNLGYTWLVAGAVYRPGNVIDWAGYPNFPTINSEKTTWFLSSWNFGVEWTY